MGTREKILEEALTLFSQKGYNGTSVREIAGAAGIKESSLYNHFANKQEIFDRTVEFCWQEAEAYFKEKDLPFSGDEDLCIFGEENFSLLSETLLGLFGYFFDDPVNVRFRKLLLLSQFENRRAQELYRKVYCEYPLKVQAKIFSWLMESGSFRKGDPEAAALEFYGGVFLLLHTCSSMEEAKPSFLAHLKQFAEHHLSDESKGKKERKSR